MTNLPSRPAKGELFTRKTIVSVGSSIVTGGERFGGSETGDGVADIDAIHTDDGAKVAGGNRLSIHSAEPLEMLEPADLRVLLGAVAFDERHLLTEIDCPSEDASDSDPADITVRVERGHEHLQGRLFVAPPLRGLR